ncbi:MAG: sterol desaturase family protein [Caldimonas sp.]
MTRSPTRKSVLVPMVAIGCLASLLWLERRRPLRRPALAPAARVRENIGIGIGAALVAAAVEGPLTNRLASAVERTRIGLVPQLRLSPFGERVAALLLFDYTLYLWHVLLHRMPVLWKWHRVHHADKDLDVSTAVRFHAAEMASSLPWRAAQVLLIGVGPATLDLWRRLTLVEVIFHHANLRLPNALEAVLGCVVMTPRSHSIHHSDVQAHQRSNLSSGLAVWDLLHGTAMRNVPQASITIGLPAERSD